MRSRDKKETPGPHPACQSVVMESQAIECESNFMAASCRTLRGEGYEPASSPQAYGLQAGGEARAGLNPWTFEGQFNLTGMKSLLHLFHRGGEP